MTTQRTTAAVPVARQRSAPAASARRVASLARAEALLLWRNRTALLNAAVLPVFMVLLLQQSAGGTEDLGQGAAVVVLLAAFSLLFVVYYNLVTAFVARRDELVLKRLRTGEVSDGEILAGTAVPAVIIAWGQILIGTAVAVAVLGMAVPVNPLLLVVALVFGTAVFVLLAAASSVVTRNVETAQITTLPVLLVPLVLSGLYFPLDALPSALEVVARLLPLSPVVELLGLGLTGATPDGRTLDLGATFTAAVVPLAVLLGWVVLTFLVARRWFRWEPRR